MVKAVIFDMDGTLVDSEPLHKIARDKVLCELGIFSEETSNRAIGRSKREYWQMIADENSLAVNGDKLTVTEFNEIINIIKRCGLKPTLGTEKLLFSLYEKGIKMAVASSSDRVYVECVIDYFGWEKYFSVVVTCDEVENAKPAPDLYLCALNLLYVSEKEAIAVEDSDTGSLAATRAGLRCIGFSDERVLVKQKFSYCEKNVSDMTKIFEIL